ncbi:MAG: dTDP-4-dehydrorhamnose reductase [Chloroflexota bacterium]
MSKILLLGKYGQVGWELQRTLASLGEVIALDFPEIDVGDPKSIRNILQTTQPEVIINATAYNAVDQAEKEPEIAMRVNGRGPACLAEQANKLEAALIHYSSDYVFDGSKGEPYTETDSPNPLNVYGRTKLLGEQAVQDGCEAYLIFRTSWVYSLRRECFVTKVLSWAKEQDHLRIVTDQVSSPTWCRVLAEITAQTLAMGNRNIVSWIKERKGAYHLSCRGSASRYEWAEAILKQAHNSNVEKRTKRIYPAVSADFSNPAERPKYTVLNCQRFINTFGLHPPEWKEALQLAMEEGLDTLRYSTQG